MPSYTKGFTREYKIPAAVFGLNGFVIGPVIATAGRDALEVTREVEAWIEGQIALGATPSIWWQVLAYFFLTAAEVLGGLLVGYEPVGGDIDRETPDMLAELIAAAEEVAGITRHTGRTAPDVVT